MRPVRKALPKEARVARAEKIAARLEALDVWSDASSVAGFVPIHGEVNLGPLLARAHAEGKTVALPRVDLEAQRIVLHAQDPKAPLVPGAFGIPEPSPDAPVVPNVDLVLVPALAFDPRGHRVGYGKGFYDQLLPTLEGAYRCGVGYDFQLVAEVPNTAHDVALDAIVTDARTLFVDDWAT